MIAQTVSRIINTGINYKTEFSLRNKLRVFNSANLVILFISLFYSVIGLFNGFYIAVLITSYSLLSNITSFVLVYFGKYQAAFHYTMWYALLFLSAFSILFGGANNSYYYFLFLPVASNILFDDLRYTVFYGIISAVAMVFNVYFIDHYEPYYNLEAWMKYFSYPNIIFAALLIFLGVRLFKQENQIFAGQIIEQKKILEEKNQEITDSINYAKKIQTALIPAEEDFKKILPESFVLFKPKDIVSGDFYWIASSGENVFYVTADCTGHGVPGGFMTMLGVSFLDEIVNEKKIHEPAKILDVLRERIVHTLKQTGNSGENKDGMDVVICRLNRKSLLLTYAAANNSLYIFRGNTVSEYKPDKQPCGFYHKSEPFTQHTIVLEPHDVIYTFTDGYADQFGGPKGKKFKYKKLEELSLSLQKEPLQKQKQELEENFDNWRGNLEQLDDVCLIGVKV